MKNSSLYFIPLMAISGFSSKSQSRQKFIREASKFLPPERAWYGSKARYKCHVTLSYKYEQVHDLDNALKAVFDVMKRRIIPDDRNIVYCQIIVREYAESTGIRIKIKEVPKSFGRGKKWSGIKEGESIEDYINK